MVDPILNVLLLLSVVLIDIGSIATSDLRVRLLDTRRGIHAVHKTTHVLLVGVCILIVMVR